MKDPWLDPSGDFVNLEHNNENTILLYEFIEKIEHSSSAGVEYLDFDLCYGVGPAHFDYLTCLKHLAISIPSYESFEEVVDELDTIDPIPCLPVSLETLTFNAFDLADISFDGIIERVEAGKLPNLRAVMYRKFYLEDEEESEVDWEDDIESLRRMGVDLSIISHHGLSLTMSENDNWPCECWIYDLKVPEL